MTLIKCPECNAVVSNTAKTCPHCGYNTKKHFTKHDNVKFLTQLKHALIVAIIQRSILLNMIM